MNAAIVENEVQAHQIIKENMLWAAGVGTIPVPAVEYGGVLVIQLKMLKELSDMYEVEYSENGGKAIISSFLAGLSARNLAYGVVGSSIKIIPGIGSAIGGFLMAGFAAATTYAVGIVFTQHFESGGTFLTLDALKSKEAFAQAFEEGKDVAQDQDEATDDED